jgi:excisionase family DNA binding protein
MENNEKMITVKEFAQKLSMAEITVRQWIAENKIKSVKIGNMRRIPERELMRIKAGD